MAITIKDLAKETGLGSATISAYLNGVPVRSYNKEKIEQAIKKLGYIRNEYARGLKTHESRTIGVLIPELSNIFATSIISEMEEILREKGYGIIVCDCRTDLNLEQKSLRFLLSKMVDGLIVMPISTDSQALKIALDNNVPITVLDRMTDSDKVSHIVINNREISSQAVNNLIEKGLRKIALITGDMEVYTAKERRRGYQEALEAVGCYDEALVYNGGLSVEGGYQAAKRMLKECKDIEAVFVTNYEMSVGSMIAMTEEGKLVGNEIEFVGFDNVEMSKVFTPKLATVNQPLKEIGQMAAHTIMSMIAGEPARNVVLKASIE